MGAATGSRTPLDPAFVEDWSRRFLEAWNALDADGVASLCTEDVVWEDAGLPEPVRGRDGVRAFIEATRRAFPDFHVEEEGSPCIVGSEPRVLSRYRMTGTMRGPWEPLGFAPTGARISVPGVDEWTFDGELMCHYATYYDSVGMARQMGTLPPAGSPAEGMLRRVQHVQARFQRRRR